MKRLLTLILCAIMLTMTGCAEIPEAIVVNVENQGTLSNNTLGLNALIMIGNGLYYDSTTRIVYWWNGVLDVNEHDATTPTPYYASNGLPYRYNPETNTFEEIER